MRPLQVNLTQLRAIADRLADAADALQLTSQRGLHFGDFHCELESVNSVFAQQHTVLVTSPASLHKQIEWHRREAHRVAQLMHAIADDIGNTDGIWNPLLRLLNHQPSSATPPPSFTTTDDQDNPLFTTAGTLTTTTPEPLTWTLPTLATALTTINMSTTVDLLDTWNTLREQITTFADSLNSITTDFSNAVEGDLATSATEGLFNWHISLKNLADYTSTAHRHLDIFTQALHTTITTTTNTATTNAGSTSAGSDEAFAHDEASRILTSYHNPTIIDADLTTVGIPLPASPRRPRPGNSHAYFTPHHPLPPEENNPDHHRQNPGQPTTPDTTNTNDTHPDTNHTRHQDQYNTGHHHSSGTEGTYRTAANQPNNYQPSMYQPGTNQPGINQPGTTTWGTPPGTNTLGLNTPGLNTIGTPPPGHTILPPTRTDPPHVRRSPGINNPGTTTPGNNPGNNNSRLGSPKNPPTTGLPRTTTPLASHTTATAPPTGTSPTPGTRATGMGLFPGAGLGTSGGKRQQSSTIPHYLITAENGQKLVGPIPDDLPPATITPEGTQHRRGLSR